MNKVIIINLTSSDNLYSNVFHFIKPAAWWPRSMINNDLLNNESILALRCTFSLTL